MTITITASDIDTAVSIIQASEFGGAVKSLQSAAKAKFANVPDDAVAAEDWLDLAAKVPGLSELGDISALIKVAMLINSMSSPYPNGGVFGAFSDSLAGVVRPVSDPDGS